MVGVYLLVPYHFGVLNIVPSSNHTYRMAPGNRIVFRMACPSPSQALRSFRGMIPITANRTVDEAVLTSTVQQTKEVS